LRFEVTASPGGDVLLKCGYACGYSFDFPVPLWIADLDLVHNIANPIIFYFFLVNLCASELLVSSGNMSGSIHRLSIALTEEIIVVMLMTGVLISDNHRSMTCAIRREYIFHQKHQQKCDKND